MDNQFQIALISAGSALSGVLLSQLTIFINSYIDRKNKKEILLRQKYEETMFYFSSSLEWMKNLDNCKSKESILSLSQATDSRKVLSLCLLYFPELVDAANQYIFAQVKYFESVIKNYNGNIDATAGGQALVHDPNHCEVQNNLMNRKNILENLIVKLASKYTRA